MTETSTIPEPGIRVPASLLRRLMQYTHDCYRGGEDAIDERVWADFEACADLIRQAETDVTGAGAAGEALPLGEVPIVTTSARCGSCDSVLVTDESTGWCVACGGHPEGDPDELLP
jgi:hypothetical protein